jgi:hypothetical protein
MRPLLLTIFYFVATACCLQGQSLSSIKENELHDWIEEAGFSHSEVRVVAKEVKEPGFETILATGLKSSA